MGDPLSPMLFLSLGRNYTYGVLQELEELLISSPSYRLVRIVDPGLRSRKIASAIRVLVCM